MLKLNLTIVILLLFTFICCSSSAGLRARTNCPTPKIQNGKVRLRSNGRSIRFQCNPGYSIHGQRMSFCRHKRWEDPIPLCIKPGCSMESLGKPSPYVSMIMKISQGASALLFCMPNYQVVGSHSTFCNGTHWDRPLGTCRQTNIGPQTSCDFETADICGWTNDPSNDYEWIRGYGYNTFEHLVSGPSHDHTTGKPLHGYYIVAEQKSPAQGSRSNILSPIYDKKQSENACIRMYYYMYGSTVGSLKVYAMPAYAVQNDTQYLVFEISGNQGKRWIEAFFSIPSFDQDFRIAIESVSDYGIISDIAIDDFDLLNDDDCLNALTSTTTESVTDEIGVFKYQSCKDRCNEPLSQFLTQLHINPDNDLEVCDCHKNCISLLTCCPDFYDMCIKDDDEDTMISNTSRSTVSTTITTNATTTPTSTTKPTTKPTVTPKATTTTPLTTTTTIKPTTKPTITTKATTTTPTPTSTSKITRKMIPTTIKPFTETKPTKSIMSKVTKEKPSTWKWVLLAALSCIIVSILIFINRRFKQYDLQNVQFNTKYYKKSSEVPLVRSTSFTADGIYSNEAMNSNVDDDSDDNAAGKIVNKLTMEKSTENNNNEKKKSTINEKFKKQNGDIDEYSDMKLLTLDEDEDDDNGQIDFNLQSIK